MFITPNALGGVEYSLSGEPTLTGLNNTNKKIDSKKKFFQPKESRVIGLHSTRLEKIQLLQSCWLCVAGTPPALPEVMNIKLFQSNIMGHRLVASSLFCVHELKITGGN